MTLTNFLSAFYPKDTEPIFLSVIHADKSQQRARNFPVTIADLKNSADAQSTLKKGNQDHGVYFFPNAGGTKVTEITRLNAFFCESDDKSIEEQHAALDSCPLAPSIRVETKKSVHAYWLVKERVGLLDWTDIQGRLIQHFQADEKIKNPNRLMRLPFFNHVRFESGKYEYKKVALKTFDTDLRYTAEEMQQAFLPVPKAPTVQHYAGGFNNETWDGIMQELRFRISQLSTYRIESNRTWATAKGVCHDGQNNSALTVNLRTGSVSCKNHCTIDRILQTFHLERPKREMKVKLLPKREQVSNTAKWLKSLKQENVQNNQPEQANEREVIEI